MITKLCDRILATRYLQLQKKRRALMAKPVARTYIPRMDICDDEHIPRVFAALELPGVRRESLTLQVINDYLLVEGDRATPLQAVLSTCSPSPVEGEGQSPTTDRDGVASAPPSIPHYSTRELAFGRFKREVALPKGITANQVTADLMEAVSFHGYLNDHACARCTICIRTRLIYHCMCCSAGHSPPIHVRLRVYSGVLQQARFGPRSYLRVYDDICNI
ncbi:unnamed protein product [Somion occarium]|uniref:Small heat shock protein n=1 Tax=Somion occarium TaxID=3059160 RepID=A0ABP1DPG6_9APHY